MPYQSKGKNANARVSEELYRQVQAYAESISTEANRVSVGSVIREALQEYIWSHPIKVKEPTTKSVTKKGA